MTATRPTRATAAVGERDAVRELLDAPYGHLVTRDRATGDSHVTLYKGGRTVASVTAPTFDEAVLRALDQAREKQ